MSTQMSFFEPPRRHDGVTLKAYRPNGQEVPAHLPRLEEGAETMNAIVLEWFRVQRERFDRTGASEDVAFSATQCAEALGFDRTSIRPRITSLKDRLSGPRLEHCRWLARRPTKKGSEGLYRYVPGELVPAKEGNQ